MTSLLRWTIPLAAMAMLALGLYTATATAQDAPATQPSTEPTTQPTGSITVTVTDQDSKPVADATVSVTVRRRRGAAPAGGAAAGRAAPLATGQTDDKGTISFPNLPAGNYNVSARSSAGRGRARVAVTAGETVAASVQLAPAAGGGGNGGGGGAAGGGAN